MLSTTQTLICPTCDQPAIVRVLTVRRGRDAERSAFEPQLTFCCRTGCSLDLGQIRRLCGMDVAAG